MDEPERAVRARLEDLTGPRPSPAERDLLARLLGSFLTRCRPGLAALGETIRRGDHAEVERQAHLLKGSAANIGATALAGLLEHLEDRATGGDLPDAEPTVRGLVAELDRVTPVVAGLAREYQRAAG